jgi:putative ABC transport system permease protein
MWSIALKTLVSDRGKLLTALVGVIFSVVLVNIQGGLFLGMIRKASLLVDHCQADVWVGHKNMHNVDFPRDIPRRWLHRIRSVPGVKRADPVLIGFNEMTLPSGGYEDVLVVGSERASPMGRAWNLTLGSADAVGQTDGIIVDASEADKLEHPRIGDVREIGGRRARIVAQTYGIVGFLVTPYVFTTYERAAVYLQKDPHACSYFLVQLQPGVKAEEVCAAIRRRLPEADALPRDVYARLSINFWMTRTGIGISFGAATLMGLFVGMVMVAQALYALVLDRIAEFGTLKAIGATDRQIHSLLLLQSLTLALAGSTIGLAIVWVIQQTLSTPKAPIAIPGLLAMGSCSLVTTICLGSSLLPYLRVRKVDPLMVLQS